MGNKGVIYNLVIKQEFPNYVSHGKIINFLKGIITVTLSYISIVVAEELEARPCVIIVISWCRLAYQPLCRSLPF